MATQAKRKQQQQQQKKRHRKQNYPPQITDTIKLPRKVLRAGEVNNLCEIDPMFCLLPIFRVRRSIRINIKQAKPEPPPTLDHYIKIKGGGVLRVRSIDPPTYNDMSLFMNLLTIAQGGAAAFFTTELKPYKFFDGIDQREIIGFKIGKGEFERWLDLAHGTGTQKATEAQLLRLTGTQLIEYNSNFDIVRVFNMLFNISTTGGAYTIFVDRHVLDMCTASGHLVRWLSIHKLKKQEEKGLLAFIDCNTSQMINIGEGVLVQLLFAVKKPTFDKLNVVKYDRHGNVDERATLSALGWAHAEAVKQYAIDMRSYEANCREYRKRIKAALEVLTQEGLIKSFNVALQPKANRIGHNRRYTIIKSDYQPKIKGPATAYMGATPAAVAQADDSEEIPF